MVYYNNYTTLPFTPKDEGQRKQTRTRKRTQATFNTL